MSSLSGVDAAGARRGHDRRLVAGHAGVGVGPCVEQQFDDLGVAVGGGHPQRPNAVAVGRLGIGPGAHQHARHRGVFALHRPVERGRAVDGRRVDVDGLLPQQRADRLRVALPGGIDQIDGRSTGGEAGPRQQNDRQQRVDNIRIGGSCTLISKIGQAAGAVAQARRRSRRLCRAG